MKNNLLLESKGKSTQEFKRTFYNVFGVSLDDAREDWIQIDDTIYDWNMFRVQMDSGNYYIYELEEN